ncbi:amidase [Streptomyces sp. B1866]|uniref:amidase n=1 Tax=Streptomyces sp. B1866 TaxID=3075431 RepID=UPI0028923001|nr:amidase [Streptomyces sp. B1866]MDT3398621.1 amidase [Streptomyces sp. B1866]
MTASRVHAFGDDALADHDAVALAALIRGREVSPREAAEAAAARVAKVDPRLNAVVYDAETPTEPSGPAAEGPFAGVPTYVKDNTAVRGMPTGHGSRAVVPHPAARHGAFARQFLSAGFTVLGKSRMPEFGLNASTEFAEDRPTRNPWHTGYSCGASSGGAAALVASGAVPLAHANDGGGSIRIPAACCGLVGLKPTRGRLVDGEVGRGLPINVVAEGVVTRSVRDTAAFFAAADRYWRNPALPALELVEGPSDRRLRVGLILETVNGAPIDAPTRAAVEATARALEKLGHRVEPAALPVGPGFVRDFVAYWGLLSFLISTFGKRLHPGFDARRLDGLTRGLRALYLRRALGTPGTLYRLGAVRRAYAETFGPYDVVVSPVLTHTTPRLGHLSPRVPFDDLLERLVDYVGFTPLHNVSGAPGLSLPGGVTDAGLPVGVHLSGRHGDERTLLEVAFALEQERPWRRIQDPDAAETAESTDPAEAPAA